MPATYEPIATTTLTSATSSVTFSSIPQTYTDLILVAAATTANTDPVYIQVGNGTLDTGTNYSNTRIYGDGSSASSSRQSTVNYGFHVFNAINSDFNTIYNFQNYSNTTTNKTVIGRTNTPGIGVMANVGLWRSTSAINIIKIYNYYGDNYPVGSTFTLYGIKAA